MSLFIVPIYTAPNASAHVHFSLPSRKRKRTSSGSSEDSYTQQDDRGLTAASTNPLSLTPDEITQYRVAGLDLGQKLPGIPGWPHRALPREKEWFTYKSQVDEKAEKPKRKLPDSEDVENNSLLLETNRTTSGATLRMQHLTVLTAILQRCLLEGDIPRATRAWSMLLRAQFGGLGADIRSTGYWGIGAELLIRSSETHAKNKFVAEEKSYEDSDPSNRTAQSYGLKETKLRRWGSTEGHEKAKAYFERMILQYPYKRQFHDSVNTLDFWAAMISCEIYGIQYEQKSSLQEIFLAEQRDERTDVSDSESDNSEYARGHSRSEDDEPYSNEHKKSVRRIRRKAEKRWVMRDETRRTALAAAEALATRLDELMTTPPYTDSHVLLRVRGDLALYIGNLSVPAMPIEDDKPGKDREGRLLFRQRISDHERGKEILKGERRKAETFFERVTKDGGDIPDLNVVSIDQDKMEVSYDSS